MNSTTNNLRISCLVLSCDSHINKGSSVFHSLVSVLNQTYDNFEVIISENSHIKTLDLNVIKQFCNELNTKRIKPVHIKFINNRKSLSWGAARNKMASFASGDVLVFLDDDTIILDNQAFKDVAKLSSKYDCGYGAARLWTQGNWFQVHASSLLKELLKNNFSALRLHAGRPKRNIRGSGDVALQELTFIGNFGFCKRFIFHEVGAFPDYKGYGFEDDYLMFKLYNAGYRRCLLTNLTVVHVNHDIVKTAERSLIPYFQDLIKHGYYWFHVSKLFLQDATPRNLVLEKLKPIHFDYRLEEAYQLYSKLRPLDITLAMREQYIIWTKNNQYSKATLAQLICLLQNTKNLDQFISQSRGDFDNLALIIKVAIECGFIKIDSRTGTVTKNYFFSFTKPYIEELVEDNFLLPKTKYNQFPCDAISLRRRVDLFKQRYPFVEYLKIGIIGDDDLLSVQFKNDYWAWPVVVETDKDIVDIIKRSDSRIEVYVEDVRNFDRLPKSNLATFITDPPYTLHGVLAFICAGLHMLSIDGEEKEFYVIMNETMMGKSLYRLHAILTETGVHLTSVVENFSQYKIPSHFKERVRAKRFLTELKIVPTAVNVSSSSNLYIFRTIKPNISKLRKFIELEKIYEHY